jgi:glycosyltransferase involved in cell wall biosynthesis
MIKYQLKFIGYPLIKNVDHLVNTYITLTPWHKYHICDQYKLSPQKVQVIGNGLPNHLALFKGETKKIPGKFIWISDCHRGLMELVKNFHQVLKIIPNAHIDVYRSLPKEMDSIKSLSFVNIKGYMENDRIIDALQQAEYWFYPTKWCETFCISALEAQYTRCICIVSDLAGLTDTVADRGILLKSRIYSEEYWQEAYRSIKNLESNPILKEQLKDKAYLWAIKQVWKEKVKFWHNLFI